MAILDDNGFWVTYDSNRLIQRLTHDIQEYGSKQKVLVRIHNSSGAKIYTDYELIKDESLESIEKIDNREILTARYLLKKLNQQNRINLSFYS